MALSRADFSNAAPGALIDLPEGLPAFIPHPLPPTIPETLAVMSAHGRAALAVGDLCGSLRHMGVSPGLLAYPMIRREAYYSSMIEGTYTTPTSMALFEADIPSAASDIETREVVNYVRAMREAVRLINEEKLPFSHRLLKEAHAGLLAGIPVERSPGQRGRYRTTQNYIGKRQDGVIGSRFVPPPPGDVDSAMQELERFVNTQVGVDKPIPILISLALIHYQFETIHPFDDGNGRIGRMIIPLILLERGGLDDPVVHISMSVEKRRDEYLERLRRVSQLGDWEGWIIFFLEVVEDSAKDAQEFAGRFYALSESYRARYAKSQVSAKFMRLIDYLFQSPTMTIGDAMKELAVTHQQAAKYLRRLERDGILKEMTGGARNLVFSAPEVFNLIATHFQPPTPPAKPPETVSIPPQGTPSPYL